MPDEFEVDAGYADKCVIRTKSRKRWHERGASKVDKQAALVRLHNHHKSVRLYVSCISAPQDLWYLKRDAGPACVINRFNLTIIIAVMHRLSELSRYDPKGLAGHLNGQANWLLTEFVQLAPAQFIDELVCEMTSLEIRLPGVRP
jgi:hypothetical protein